MPLWVAVWILAILLILVTYYLTRWTLRRPTVTTEDFEFICPIEECTFYLKGDNELMLGFVVSGHMENSHGHGSG